MWKPIGIIFTLLLLIYSLISLAIAAWYYDQDNLSNSSVRDNYKVYVDSLRAVLAVDLFFFIVSFVGVFLLVKPNQNCAKIYAALIVLLLLFKLIAGSIWYNGGDDNGRGIHRANDSLYSYLDKLGATIPDGLKAWKAARNNELASIILFIVFGLLSAVGVVKAGDS